ncbi:MAG: gliding motility-associated C-terminal domain-containing protein, partial [Bacteroidetes bacterium]
SGDTTLLNATPGYVNYDWSTDGAETQISVFSEDSYAVTVTDQNGCQSATVEFVEEIPNPVADAGPELFLDCDTHSAVLMADNSTQGSGFTYQWSGPGINASNQMELTPEISVPGTYQLLVTDEIHGCLSTPATAILTDLSYEPAALLAEPEILNCETEIVLIDGSNCETGTHIVYQWFDGQNNQISGAFDNNLSVSEASMYSILVLDTLTACSSMASTIVNEDYNYPAVEAGPNQHLNCIIESASLNGENSSQGNSFGYSWSSNDGNILSGSGSMMAIVNEPGHYYLTVLNTENGCASMDSVLVTQDITPPIANAGMDMEINCHQSSVELNGLASSIGNQFTLNWIMGNNPSVISTTPLTTVETPGIYHLMITNLINGCESLDEVVVNAGPLAPTGIDFETETPTCFGDADGALIIQEVLGGEGPYLYSLEEGNFQQSSIFNQLGGGVYEVLVQDVNGCEFQMDVQVPDGNDLWLDLGEDQTIELGDEADLYALFNIPETSIMDFFWNPDPNIHCDSCYIQMVSPVSTNTYGATLIDENGCSTSDLVTIYVQKNRNVYIPNVFSPNLDGNNDIFMIFSGKGVAEVVSFQIYNRWGEQVFEEFNFQPNNPAHGWDGRFRGRNCNSAVFVWYAEIAFDDDEIILFKGDVTLIR